jgi:hypothetical protein
MPKDMGRLRLSDRWYTEMQGGKKDDISKLLSSIYFNPSRVGSFGGLRLLQEQANLIRKRLNKQPISRRTTEIWGSKQEAYVEHKVVPTRKFPRNPVIFDNKVLTLCQADVIFFTDVAHYGYNYMLLFQDVASRYLLYRFLKTKTCAEVLAKIKDIFESLPFIPRSLQTDSGSEFFCKSFQDYMKQVDCNHYSVGGGDSGKTPHLDNATRTIQRRVHRYFTHKETTNWVKVMPQIISSQNRTRNRITGKTPKDIWDNKLVLPQPQLAPTKEKPKFKVGDWVSILGSELGSLSHQYKGEWTYARFKIVNIDVSKPVRVMYYLEDELGETIKNGFYSNELTLADFPDSKKIEKILKRKTVAGVKWVLVRYKRRDKRYDSWIKASDMRDIPKVTIKHGKFRR